MCNKEVRFHTASSSFDMVWPAIRF